VELIALRLAKAGYYGGDPGAIKRAPVDDVLNVLSYDVFLSEYDSVEYEINKKE